MHMMIRLYFKLLFKLVYELMAFDGQNRNGLPTNKKVREYFVLISAQPLL